METPISFLVMTRFVRRSVEAYGLETFLRRDGLRVDSGLLIPPQRANAGKRRTRFSYLSHSDEVGEPMKLLRCHVKPRLRPGRFYGPRKVVFPLPKLPGLGPGFPKQKEAHHSLEVLT